MNNKSRDKLVLGLALVTFGCGLWWSTARLEAQRSDLSRSSVSLKFVGLVEPTQNASALVMPSAEKLKRAFPGGTRQVLEGSSQLVLFSVDPLERYVPSSTDPKSWFHGHRVLGQTTITDAAARKALLASFYDGMAPANISPMSCFSPRHGVRATVNGKVVDVLICFTCHQFEIYDSADNDEKRVAHETVLGSPRPTFDAILTAAGVPISP